MLSSEERVLKACAFQAVDRIPRFDKFWSFPEHWRRCLGDPADLSDVKIWVPEEGAFPTRQARIKEEAGYEYLIDEWGRTIRQKEGAYFYETLAVPLPEGIDIDTVNFDPPDLDCRYLQGQQNLSQANVLLQDDKRKFCVFGKTGGPYLRSTFVRGEQQFLTDIAGDQSLARAISQKVADHLTAVGIEEIRRWSLEKTGIWIYDDMGSNNGPMFSPQSFEKIFLEAYRRMIRAYKHAGARYVFLHSDGNILPVLDMLVEAGVDGLNPLERRAGMDILKIRHNYPQLILVGGMDNTGALLHGPVSRIEAEAREIIDAGRHGGLIIGTHSINPQETPLEHFLAYDKVCKTYGDFSQSRH